MATHAPDDTIKITILERSSLEQGLNTAVTLVQTRAMLDKSKGILVTRLAPDHFTVALSEDVPFGWTHEKQVEAGGRSAACCRCGVVREERAGPL